MEYLNKVEIKGVPETFHRRHYQKEGLSSIDSFTVKVEYTEKSPVTGRTTVETTHVHVVPDTSVISKDVIDRVLDAVVVRVFGRLRIYTYVDDLDSIQTRFSIFATQIIINEKDNQ